MWLSRSCWECHRNFDTFSQYSPSRISCSYYYRNFLSHFLFYFQHDSQEFLSFLLNTLHDLLNDTTKRIRNHNNHHNGNGKKETSSDDLSDNIHGEVSKRLKMDSDVELNTPMEADAGVECEEHLSKAARAWRWVGHTREVLMNVNQGPTFWNLSDGWNMYL